jgi:hypothetical protein
MPKSQPVFSSKVVDVRVTATILGQMNGQQQNDPGATDRQWKLFQARYGYAWACFDFHAKQRMTMFNFFLIFAGFVINAWVAAIDKQLYVPAIVVSLVGAVVAAFFVFLERRNEELVYIAEDVLEKLENDVLFVDFKAKVISPRRRNLFGCRERKDKREITLGILSRQTVEENDFGKSPYSHGNWMPGIQILVLIVFVGFAFIGGFWRPDKTQPTVTQSATTQRTP